MKFDTAVIGGGFSGFAAAISAAREGLKVILIEKGNCMGGAASNCLVQPFMPYVADINGEAVLLSRGIFEEITDNFKKMYSDIDGVEITEKSLFLFNEEYMKVIFNRMAEEAGVTLLYHSYIISAEMKDNRVKSVKCAGSSGCFDIEADYFIDATGDANLAYLCGYPFRLGRESDNLCQPMTLCFRIANIDNKVCENIPYAQINELYNRLQNEGKITNPRENVLIFKTLTDGILHFNTTRVVKLNPTDPFDLTKAEIIAREQVMEIYLMLKRNIPGFENSRLIMTAPEIGIRESRMIDGEYTLTGEVLKACTVFDDAIALGNYEIDIHSPDGSGTSHYFFKQGEYYTIPYRCLIPKKSENLLVAGRCISCDHNAQASIRIMPIVCTIGEAAGTAAAIAFKSGKNVSDIDITLLRKTLKDNGAAVEI